MVHVFKIVIIEGKVVHLPQTKNIICSIGASKNKYQNEAKGIFSEWRYCMETKRKVLSFVSKLFSDSLIGF